MTVRIRDVTESAVNSRSGKWHKWMSVKRSKQEMVKSTMDIELAKFTRMLKREIVKGMLEVGQGLEESQRRERKKRPGRG